MSAHPAPPPERAPRPSAGSEAPCAWGWLLLALAVGLALRSWEAVESSLWLDELHTLAHASQPDLGAVTRHVARDNHTPLFFWAVHLLGGWEQAGWLRALPVLTSLLLLLPLIAVACSLGAAGRRTATLAAWLVACLPYQVHYAAMLRPYAWIGVLGASAVWVAFSERGPRWLRFLLFFAFVLLGLWTHRVMALIVVAIGFARLFVRTPGMLGLGWLVLAGTLAVAPSVPWLMGFAERVTQDRFDFQERIGGYKLRPVLVKEVLALPARLFVPYMGILGKPWTTLAYSGSALFFGGALGVVSAWGVERARRRIGPLGARARGLLLFTAAAFLLIMAASLWSWDRVPLQYYTPVVWAVPVLLAFLLASLSSARLRQPLAAVLGASALLLGVAQAGGRCTEDMRGAVAEARRFAAGLQQGGAPEPIFTALLSQPPEVFEHRLPYYAYGRDLTAVEPADVPRFGEPGFERPLIVLRRDMQPWRPEWQALRYEREVLTWTQVDEYLSVVVLVPADGE